MMEIQMKGTKHMKTWARAKAVMNAMGNKVVKVLKDESTIPDPVPVPDYDNMKWKDLKLCAKNEGISTYHKSKDELIAKLWANFNGS